MKIQQFIKDNGLTIKSTPVKSNPQINDSEWAEKSSHFLCEIEMAGSPLFFTTYFSVGPGIVEQSMAKNTSKRRVRITGPI
jgi:hypothetical protein